MKKNLYYAATYKRYNVLKMNILSFFLVISSYPRLLLEVFLRKNMGERYFTVSSALTVAVIVGAIPIYFFSDGYSFWDTVQTNKLYYAFLAAFVVFSAVRYLEIRHAPSVFDFGRFSNTGGIIHPFFYKIKLFGKEPSVRTVEIYYEPLPFFIAGIILFLTEMNVLLGLLLVFCSVIYSLSHSGAYMLGDHFIMDRIDEIICNEDLSQAFVKDEESPRGFRWHGRKPSSEDLRKEYVEDICFEDVDEVKDDDTATAS